MRFSHGAQLGVSVQITDHQNNNASAALGLNYTTNITFTTKLNGSTTADNATVSFYKEGTLIYNVTINDTMGITNDSFNVTVDLTTNNISDGYYNIIVNATNSTDEGYEGVNNTWTNIIIDSSGPSITYNLPANQQAYQSNDTIMINVTVTDTWLDIDTVIFNVTNNSSTTAVLQLRPSKGMIFTITLLILVRRLTLKLMGHLRLPLRLMIL